jgi:hypothetical protein
MGVGCYGGLGVWSIYPCLSITGTLVVQLVSPLCTLSLHIARHYCYKTYSWFLHHDHSSGANFLLR